MASGFHADPSPYTKSHFHTEEHLHLQNIRNDIKYKCTHGGSGPDIVGVLIKWQGPSSTPHPHPHNIRLSQFFVHCGQQIVDSNYKV